ncbi:MAG: DUF4054 domain-containing protein [Bacteroidales bacterium]|nr:DUF4054 domain-containing protein [Bacteroidales bacterium]
MIALFTEAEYEKLISMVKTIGKGEFDSLSEQTMKFWIDFVQPMVSKKQFKKLYYQALALLICHKLKMNGEGENSLGDLGKIENSFVATSVSDGGSSISFAGGGANNLQTDAEYALTSYGLQYLQLRKMCIIPVRVSGEEMLYAGI